MEASTSETSVDIQLRTWQYIPEDSELHTRRRENLKAHKTLLVTAPLDRNEVPVSRSDRIILWYPVDTRFHSRSERGVQKSPNFVVLLQCVLSA
jgi:hypothetical protein